MSDVNALPRPTLAKYLAYVASTNLAFYVPILLVHFQKHGVGPEGVFVLVSTYTFVLAVTDVPTGMIAGAVGARPVLVASLVAAAAGALLLGMSSSMIGFLIGQSLVALALSLRSGADASYLFALSGGGRSYQRTEGLATSTTYVALGLGSIAGALLSVVDDMLPFGATAVALVVGLIAFGTLPDVAAPTAGTRSLRAVTRASIEAVRRDRVLAFMIPLVAGLLTVAGIAYWSLQLYLAALDVPVALFGLAYAAYFLAAAIGARLSSMINNGLGQGTSLVVASVVLGAAVLLMGTVSGFAGVALPLVTQFVTGYLFPTFRYLIQQRIPPDTRATILSTESVAQRTLFTVSSLAMGAAVGAYGISGALARVGVLALFLLPTAAFLVTRSRSFSVPASALGVSTRPV